ncbi:MAG: hypothetical protein RIT28_2305 [Pseudomonadota bacterium]
MPLLCVRRLAPLLVLGLGASVSLAADPPALLGDTHREALERIEAAAEADNNAYERLRELCDRFGHRLSGSAALESAIDWAVGELVEDGLDARKEPVTVAKWVRGAESAALTHPRAEPLAVLGLGMGVPTPPGGVEAEVIAVASLDALRALPEGALTGKIILVDQPFTDYGETVQIRSQTAIEGARRGAVAALIRSVTSESLNTPHTGAIRYADGVTAIPAAALSPEHAALLHRLYDAGQRPRVRLSLASERLPDATSYNVVADLKGREKPEEIVLLGCHLDSWDVGQGAQDDGAGCVLVWHAASLLKAQGLTPRRTVRVVLYTNEENGLAGGRAYAADHAAELDNHVVAIESDTGNGRTSGMRVDLQASLETAARLRAQGLLWELSNALLPYGAGVFTQGGAGADIWPLTSAGVPGLGVDHDTTDYWPIHHTEADTFEKIKLDDLRYNLSVITMTAYLLAEHPERLVNPVGAPPPRRRR